MRLYKRNSIWIGYNVPDHYAYYIITTLINAVQQKNNDTSAFYTHFRSDFQDVFNTRKKQKKAFEMLLETEIKNTICTADQKESRLLRYLVG